MTLRLTLFGHIDPAPRKTWLVSGLIGAGELGVMFGAPGSGKSVLAGDMAAHIAAGRSWLGRTVASGAVLYLAAERAALTKRRFAAWRIHHQIDDLPLGVADGSADLCSGEAVADILAKAREVRDTFRQELRLIVVDTVSRTLAGGDENSPKDMGRYVTHVGELHNETGAAILLVHHIPADGTQRLRGHGALLGAADVTLGVEKHATGRTATLDKANDGEEGERVTFDLQSVQIADDGTTAPVVVATDMPVQTSSKRPRKLPDRVKNSLDVLADQCLDGHPLPPGGDLPPSIRAVSVDAWRDELYRRGILDQGHPNPREDFKRVKAALQARHLAAEREGLIWAV